MSKFAYVGREGIWPNTVLCEKHSTPKNLNSRCRVMLAINTTAWPEDVETELPCVVCDSPAQPTPDEVTR